MKLVNGYRILCVIFPPVPHQSLENQKVEQTAEGSLPPQVLTAQHHLYLKEHSDHQHPENNGKILFVGNVDYFLGISYENIQQYLTLLFQSFGEIESISIAETDEDITRYAHILFQKKSSVKYLLKTATDQDYERLFQSDVAPFLQSIRRKNILADRNIATVRQNLRELFPLYDVDPVELQEKVDKFMAEYEEQEKIEFFERKDAKNRPDEDGFVTVVSRSKRKHEETLKAAESSAGTSKRHSNKRKKSTELKNFYSFQIKEEKMKQLDILRKRFEDNKEKIQKMKEQRKFNPF